MTSKQRAYLRSMASQIDTIFQIGKGGLSEAFYKQVDEALTTRELIKVRVLLETTPISPPYIALATPMETAKIIRPTASSSATMGRSRSASGPLALY